jgi:putative transposase
MRRAFKYRLYPTKAQERLLTAILDGAHDLYNAALDQRRLYWSGQRRSINYYFQAAQLKEARDADPRLALLNYSACQEVLRRLQKAFDAFFRRVNSGQAPGYPRFKARDRFNSVIFPAYGDGVRLGKRLRVQNVGDIKIKLHRPVEGTIKTVTIKREAGTWTAAFSCDEVESRKVLHPISDRHVGLDMGLDSFAALTTGEKIENPRWFRKTEERLVEVQRRISRKKKRSGNYYKEKKRLARLHAKAANQRRDFQHKLANDLVSTNAFIAVEDLDTQEMIENGSTGLSKSIHDAGWAQFLAILSCKAEEAGRTFVKVPAQGTSSTCFQCGTYRKKALSERTHRCPCGLVLDRDIHASLNILRLGRSLRDSALCGTEKPPPLGGGVVTSSTLDLLPHSNGRATSPRRCV